MGVVDHVIVLRGVPLKRDAAVADSALELVANALWETFGNERVIPERRRSVDGSSSLSRCAHLSIVVRFDVYGCDTNDAIGGKYVAHSASAIEPDDLGRFVCEI